MEKAIAAQAEEKAKANTKSKTKRKSKAKATPQPTLSSSSETISDSSSITESSANLSVASNAEFPPKLPQRLEGVKAYRSLRKFLKHAYIATYEEELIVAMIENCLTIKEAAKLAGVGESTIKS